MKNKKLIPLIILSILFLSSFHFSTEISTQDSYYDSLLSIESARKLYKKKHYEEALASLLKVASITKNNKLKSEAIIEIAFVKFLMGYSSQSYGVFIKRSIKLYRNIELSPNHYAAFKKVFKKIQREYIPEKPKTKSFRETIIKTSRSELNGIKDMELKNNLMFKLKKEISTLKESNNQLQERDKILKQKLLSVKKNNNKIASTITRQKKIISSLKTLRERDYKSQYIKLKTKTEKIEKTIKEQDKIIFQLREDRKKEKLELIQQNGIKTEKKNKLDTTLKKENVFKTLHQIWEKSL